jgi:hypothetical protein
MFPGLFSTGMRLLSYLVNNADYKMEIYALKLL